MLTDDEGGAEAVTEELHAPDTTEQQTEDTDLGGDAEDETGGAEVEGQDKPRAPLSPEEYEKRHENLNKALKQEREDKRAMRAELARVSALVEKVSKPEHVERLQLDADLKTYAAIDWDKWFEQNPAEADKHLKEYRALANRKDQLDGAEKQQTQEQQQQQEAQALQQLGSTLVEQEASFKEAHPDYDDACEHLKGELRREANAQGWFGEQAEQAVNAQLVQIGKRVNASGKDMAEFGYNLAVQRGYKPKTADIASVKAGAGAAKTISNLGGSSSNEGGSFEETMAGLNGAAATKYWEKVKRERNA